MVEEHAQIPIYDNHTSTNGSQSILEELVNNLPPIQGLDASVLLFEFEKLD